MSLVGVVRANRRPLLKRGSRVTLSRASAWAAGWLIMGVGPLRGSDQPLFGAVLKGGPRSAPCDALQSIIEADHRLWFHLPAAVRIAASCERLERSELPEKPGVRQPRAR